MKHKSQICVLSLLACLLVCFVKISSQTNSTILPIYYRSSIYAGMNNVGNGAPAVNATVTESKLAVSNSGDLFLFSGFTTRKVSKQTGIIDVFSTFEVACLTNSAANSEWIYFVESGGIISRIHTVSATYQVLYQDSSMLSPYSCSMNSKGDIAIVGADDNYITFGIYIYYMSSNQTERVFGNSTEYVQSTPCKDGSNALSCQLTVNHVAYSDSGIVYCVSNPGIWFVSNGIIQTLNTAITPTYFIIDRDSLLMIMERKFIQRYNMTSGQYSNVCGQSVSGNSNDGTLATNAFLNNPFYITIDYNDGGLIISEETKVRKIDPLTQKLVTLAGNGRTFINLDGLLPKQLYFTPNQHAFLAKNDDLFMVGDETLNIVKISAQDEKSVVYPLNEKMPYGKMAVGADPTSGDIFYSKSKSLVYKVDAVSKVVSLYHSNDTTLLKNTKIPIFGGDSVGLSVNQDEILIADYMHNVIRKVTKDGNVIVVAGTGKKGFSGDGGLAVDADLNSPVYAITDSNGDIWIADFENSRVRVVSSKTGVITTIAGNGDISQKSSNLTVSPVYLAESISGDSIYVSDFYGCQIKKIEKLSGKVSIIAGTGMASSQDNTPTNALSSNIQPNSLIVLSNNTKEIIYFVDFNNGFVKKLEDEIVSVIAGSGTTDAPPKEGPALSVSLSSPFGLAYDQLTGDLYVSSTSFNEVRKITPQGRSISVAGNGTRLFLGDGLKAVNSTIYPLYLAIKGRELLIVDIDENTNIGKIRTMSLDSDSPTLNTLLGGYGDGLVAQNAYFQDVVYFQFDEKGNMYTLDIGATRIRKISKSSGIIQTIAGGGTRIESGIPATETFFIAFTFTVISEDNLLIPDKLNNRIIKVLNGIASNLVGNDTGGGEPNFNVNATMSPISSPSSVIQTPDGEIIFTHYGATQKLLKISKYTQKLEELDVNYFLPPLSDISYLMRKSSTGDLMLVESSYGWIYKMNPRCSQGKLNSLKTQCVNECFGVADETLGCSNRGYCVGKDSCECFTGYNGTKCEDFTCNSVFKSESRVCSGHGVCSSFDNCTCSTGYYGMNCELFDCYGTSKNSPSVCSSGNGICSDLNKCDCKNGYYGSTCEKFDCYGVKNDNSSVCSSHGSCSSPNTCTCETGYYGNNCEIYSCFGKTYSDSNVCSGMGSCSKPNTCTCKSGYFGNSCESFNCKGIKNTDSSVCSSRGQCLSPDTCKCNVNSYGSNCEFVVAPSATTKFNTTGFASRSFRLNEGISDKMINSLMMISILLLLTLFH